jgi:hypothetical protein
MSNRELREPFGAERTAVWKAILATQRELTHNTHLTAVDGLGDVETARVALDNLVLAVLSRRPPH